MGLGTRNLKIPNNSLLMKWLWRFSGEKSTLWRDVILHKFGQINLGALMRLIPLVEWEFRDQSDLYGQNYLVCVY